MHIKVCVVSKDSADTFRLLQSREIPQSLQVTAITKGSRVTNPVAYLNFQIKIKIKEQLELQ